ncbi:peptidyl-tRNA hydrolase [Corynebacterium lubricantis]|uniref:peptidyl-tRNA hydrolase n=1 Tax=Corynebacterium lubricantis TaxID=541095 RepID=UPI000381EB7A|nr:peptidyl-tRNA hydrolase [Corynebacterium lubricantis]
MQSDLIAKAHDFLATSVSNDRREHSENPDDPATVQAMQIALYIPKSEQPARNDLLVATAQAVVGVCLAPEAISDEIWHSHLEQWYGHLIRKVARRGRNKAWDDVQALAGVTTSFGSARVRAFIPSAVSEVPAEIKKLQIQGTDVHEGGEAHFHPELPTIAVDASLQMTAGKAAAQVGHASMLFAASLPTDQAVAWAQAGFPLNVVEMQGEDYHNFISHEDAVLVRDAGFTEVAPDSITVAARPGTLTA